MPLSMFQASVPVFIRHLHNLSGILAKAEAHAQERGEAPSVLIEARLAPDMHGFARQVQIATDTAKGAAARLAGMEVPSFPDDETTFPELQDRLTKTIDFLKSVPADKIDGSEGREITMRAGPQELRFTGQDYLLHFALPNFFFHETTAYAILREKGVPLGKMDYLGKPAA